MAQLIDNRDLEILADVYMKEGQSELVNHNNALAIEKMQKALRLLKKAKSTELYVKNLNTLGVVFSSLQDEQKAFECYLEALANAEVIKSSTLKALCYINVGCCYHKLERHSEAIKYYKEAETELSKADADSQEKYQIWSMINYLNLKEAYGMLGEETDFPADMAINCKNMVYV